MIILRRKSHNKHGGLLERGGLLVVAEEFLHSELLVLDPKCEILRNQLECLRKQCKNDCVAVFFRLDGAVSGKQGARCMDKL